MEWEVSMRVVEIGTQNLCCAIAGMLLAISVAF